MAEADIKLTVSIKRLKEEIQQALQPFEQLLRRLGNDKDYQLLLSDKGAKYFAKQIDYIAATTGADKAQAKKLIDTYTQMTKLLDEAGKQLSSGNFTQAVENAKKLTKLVEQDLVGGTVQFVQEIAKSSNKLKKTAELFKIIGKEADAAYEDALLYTRQGKTYLRKKPFRDLFASSVELSDDIDKAAKLVKRTATAYKNGNAKLGKVVEQLSAFVQIGFEDKTKLSTIKSTLDELYGRLPQSVLEPYLQAIKTFENPDVGNLREFVKQVQYLASNPIELAGSSIVRNAKKVMHELRQTIDKNYVSQIHKSLAEFVRVYSEEKASLLSTLNEREARALRKQLFDLKSDVTLDTNTDPGLILRARKDLINRLRTLDEKTAEHIQQLNADLAKTIENIERVSKRVEKSLYSGLRDYVVNKGVSEFSSDVDLKRLLRVYQMVSGKLPTQRLTESLFETIMQQTGQSMYAAGLTAKGIEDSLVRMVGHISQAMFSQAMQNPKYQEDLLLKGGKNVIEGLDVALKYFSDELVNVSADKLLERAKNLRNDPRILTRLYNAREELADLVASYIEGAALHLKDKFGPQASLTSAISAHALALNAKELAEDNPFTAYRRIAQQQKLEKLHQAYFEAFMPNLYAKYQKLAASPKLEDQFKANKLMGSFVSTFGPTVESAHGLMLNTLANFISGLGVAAVFGLGYMLTNYTQQLSALNHELEAYKNILAMRGEEQMAEDVDKLRSKLVELSKQIRVNVKDVATLYGTLNRNGLSTEGVPQLLDTIGQLNELFSVPFENLKKDITSTLLSHRSRYIGPEELTAVLRVGGPQADKALNIFNQLVAMRSSLAFSVDELIKAVRYYLDTGRKVSDSYYDIARAVEYATERYDEHIKRLDELNQKYESVNVADLYGKDADQIRIYQQRVGQLLSTEFVDTLGNLGIGKPTAFFATIQTMFLGFLSLINGVSDIVRELFSKVPWLSTLIQQFLALLTSVIGLGLIQGFGRLLKRFIVDIAGSRKALEVLGELAENSTTLSTLAERAAKGYATFSKFTVRIIKYLVELLPWLGRIGTLLSGPWGMLAKVVGVTALGAYTLYRSQQRREEARKQQFDNVVFTPNAGEGGVITIVGSDNSTTNVDLKLLKDSTFVIKAITDPNFKVPGAEDIRALYSIYRKWAGKREELEKEMEDLVRRIAELPKGSTEATQLQNKLRTYSAVLTIGQRFEEVIKELETYDEALRAASALRQQAKKMLEAQGKLSNLTRAEQAEVVLQASIKALSGVPDANARSKAIDMVAQEYITNVTAAHNAEMQVQRTIAQNMPDGYARLYAMLDLAKKDLKFYVGVLRKLQDIGASLSLQYDIARQIAIQQERVKQYQNAIGALSAELARMQDRVHSQLMDAVRELFYNPQGQPNSVVKLLETAAQILEQNANLPFDQFVKIQTQVERDLGRLLPLATQYDAQVRSIERQFNAAKRTNDPKKRFDDLQKVIEQNLKLAKTGKLLPGTVGRLVELISDALFKDGGQLSQIARVADDALKQLESFKRTIKPNVGDDLYKLATGISNGMQALTDLSRMQALLVKNVESLKSVAADVYGQNYDNLKRLLANRRERIAKLVERRQRVGLTPEEEAELTRLQRYVDNLDGIIGVYDELSQVERDIAELKKKKGNLSQLDQSKLKALEAKKAELKAKLEGTKASFDQLVDDANQQLSQVVNEILDYLDSLNTALEDVARYSDTLFKNTIKDIERIKKDAKDRVESALSEFIKPDRQKQLAANIADAQDSLKDMKDKLLQDRELFESLRTQITSGNIGTFQQALAAYIDGSRPATEAASNIVEALKRAGLSKDKAKVLLGNLKTNADKVVGFLTRVLAAIDSGIQAIDARVQQLKTGGEAAKVMLGIQTKLDEAERLQNKANRALSDGDLKTAASTIAKAIALQAEAADVFAKNQKRFADAGLDYETLKERLDDTNSSLRDLRSQIASKRFGDKLATLNDAIENASDALSSGYVDDATKQFLELAKQLDGLVSQIANSTDLTDKDRQVLNDQVQSQRRNIASNLEKILTSYGASVGDDIDQLTQFFIDKGLNADAARNAASRVLQGRLNKRIEEIKNQMQVSKYADTVEELTSEYQRIGKLSTDVDELVAIVQQLGDAGVYVDDLKKALDDLRETLYNTLIGIGESISKTLQQDAERTFKQLKDEVSAANAKLDDALASGTGVTGAIRDYTEAVRQLLSFADATQFEDLGKQARDAANQAMAALFKKSGFSVDNEVVLTALLGKSAKDFIATDIGFGPLKESKTLLFDAIKKRLPGIADSTVGAIANAVVDAATRQLEKEVTGLEASLGNDAAFESVLYRLSTGQLSPREADVKLAKVYTEYLSKRVMLFQTKMMQAMLKGEPTDQLRTEFINDLQRRIENAQKFLTALQDAYQKGEIGWATYSESVKALYSGSSALEAAFKSTVDQLDLSKEEADKLGSAVKAFHDKLSELAKQIEAQAMQLYMRDDLTSKDLQYKLALKQALSGAESGNLLAVNGLVEQYLSAVLDKPGTLSPLLSKSGERTAKINLLEQLQSLNDVSLLKALGLSDDDIKKIKGNVDVVTKIIRGNISRLINDLKEDWQKANEEMLRQFALTAQRGLEDMFYALMTIPVRMMQEARQKSEELVRLEDQRKAVNSQLELWQEMYDKAVETYGTLSDEAKKYADKIAELKSRQLELNEEIKRTKQSAKSFFEYVIDAVGNFIQLLAQAIAKMAALRLAQMVWSYVDSLASSGSAPSSTAGTAPASSPATPQSAKINMNVSQPASAQPANIGGELAIAATKSAITSAINGSTLVAGAVTGLLATAAMMATDAIIAEVSSWYDKSRFTFSENALGRNALKPKPIDYYPDYRVEVNVNAKYTRQELVEASAQALDRKLREEEM